MDISVIVPVYNEDESLPELREWITRVMNENNFSYEVIMVDDGSTDTSWEIIEKMSATDNHIKGVKFRRNYGKSAALNTGFKKAQGDVEPDADTVGALGLVGGEQTGKQHGNHLGRIYARQLKKSAPRDRAILSRGALPLPNGPASVRHAA